MAFLKSAFLFAISDGVPRRSFYVALVVGTVLNVINQFDAIFGDSALNWTKVALTYCVPYLVATYGAISFRLSRLSASSND